jgi:glycosyltransferase involved in cell wall biosynthesis
LTDFSIITPSYSQLDWLRQCIASVQDQLQPGSKLSLEHIVQDAGTPGIEDLARELGAEFHRNGQLIFEANPSSAREGQSLLQRASATRPVESSGYSTGVSSQSSAIRRNAALKIFSEPDAGMYDAVNRGLARATGDLCAYLNSDDQYLPGTLATVAEFFEKNPSTEMLFGDAIIVAPDGRYLCTRMVTIPQAWHTQVHTLSIFTAATFFRRTLVTEKNIRFRPEWKIIGDAAWILDHLRANTRMALLRKPAATATETGENLILSQKTRAESHRFHSQAPPCAQALAPALILHHRLKRLLRGSYRPPAEPYAIYTQTSPTHRISFTPKNPTHRLPGRFG